jgi:hypothetical protein
MNDYQRPVRGVVPHPDAAGAGGTGVVAVVRHATVWALDWLRPWLPFDATDYRNRAACTWESGGDTSRLSFDVSSATGLRMGCTPPTEFPTCPACAAMLDWALEGAS